MTLAADPVTRRLRTLCWPLLALLVACGGEPGPQRIEGATMGTRFHITWYPEASAPALDDVRTGVEALLEAFEQDASTWRHDSTLSQFNRSVPGRWQNTGVDLVTLMLMARQVSTASGGAYDVTVGPLVNLWGFGPERGSVVPADAAIEEARARVGQQHLELDMARVRARRLQPVEVDLSSIAKGYAVDRVSDYLLERGLANHLVEIGGELRARGHKPGGVSWRVGIEDPLAPPGTVLEVLAVDDLAVATSGDYRNYFEVDGERYSHVIDPRSGRPVRHELVSVTVLHASAALADAWATALTVTGVDESLALAQREGLAVYLLRRTGEGTEALKSEAMQRRLQ